MRDLDDEIFPSVVCVVVCGDCVNVCAALHPLLAGYTRSQLPSRESRKKEKQQTFASLSPASLSSCNFRQSSFKDFSSEFSHMKQRK